MSSKTSNFLPHKGRIKLFLLSKPFCTNGLKGKSYFTITDSNHCLLSLKYSHQVQSSDIKCQSSLSSKAEQKNKTFSKVDIYNLYSTQKVNPIHLDSIPSQSTKYINFLQFLFYKEFNSQKIATSNNSYSNLNSDYNLSKKIKIPNLTHKNENQFFPYRKSWISYWLLPFMGFLSSISSKSNSELILLDFSSLYSNNCLSTLAESHENKKTRMNTGTLPLLNSSYLTNFSLDLSSNISQLPASEINKLELMSFEILLNQKSSNSIFLEMFEQFLDLWLDNSSVLKSTIPSNSLFSELSIELNKNSVHDFSKFNSILFNYDFLVYPLKFYHVPIHQDQLKKSVLQKSIKNINQNHQKIQSLDELKNLLTLNKTMKTISSKDSQFKFLKKSTYKTLESHLFSNQFTIQNQQKIKSSLINMLIGVHLKDGTLKSNPNFVNIQEENDSLFVDSNKMKTNKKILKVKNPPLKQYNEASFILDNFYTELESLKNSNSIKNQSFKIQINKLNQKNNFEVYNPSSFNKILKKNLLLNSLENSSQKLVPNLVLLSQSPNENNYSSHQNHQLNRVDFSNNHRKNYKFLENLIQYFNLKDSLNSQNDISKLSLQNLNLNLHNEILTSQPKIENSNKAKKLTKNQLYSIILESFNNTLVRSFELQNQNQFSEFSSNKSKDFNLSQITSNSTESLLNSTLNFQNQKSFVLKLTHPLIFTSQVKQNLQETDGKQFQFLKNSNQVIEKMEKKNQSNEFYTTNLNNISNTYDLTNTKKMKLTPLLSQERFLNNQQKNVFSKEKTISKSEYSSKYVDFLSFKLQKIVKKRMLNKLGSDFGKFSKGSMVKFNNDFIYRESNIIPNKKSNIEKIFRSYLSNKQKLVKTWIQKSNNKLPKSGFGLKKQVELKKKPIKNINSFLKYKLKQNLFLNFESAESRNVFKNSNFNLSINTLLKNRGFILKSTSRNEKISVSSSKLAPIESFESPQNSHSYFEKLEKRKYLQKKYRRKKQRKETRRRKKRKRFYPRPTWVRFKTYTNLLKQLSSNKKLPEQDLKQSSGLNLIHLDSSNFVKNLSLYSTKDFYQIKTSVLGELKRSFWKSYWLRSNLKPYLTRIKSDLTKIKNVGVEQTVDLNRNNLISFILGLKETQVLSGQQKISNKNQMNSFLQETKKSSEVNQSFDFNKWQLITQIAEHNRIIYERIQNLILNIRENLNINGQFKARSYKHLTRQKLKNLTSLKQNNLNNPNNDFWIKLEKNKLVRLLFQNSYKYYGSFSNYRLFWAINKSNLGEYKSVNKVKDLWMNTKNRDQSKSNKTKKILYQLSQNYKFLIQQSNIDNPKFKFSQATTKDSLPENSTLFQFSYLTPPINQNLLTPEEKSGEFSRYDSPLTSIEKCLKISERKLKQKQQKLRLTLGFFDNFGTYKLNQNATTFKFKKLESNKAQILIPTQQKSYTNEYKYWWNETKIQTIPIVKSVSSFENSTIPLWVSTFLFHFCTLISLISLSQVRDVIKFSLILVSKISKIYFEFIYYSFNSVLEFSKKLIPPKLSDMSFFSTGFAYYKNVKFKSIFSKESNLNLNFFKKSLNTKGEILIKQNLKNSSLEIKDFSQILKSKPSKQLNSKSINSAKLYLILLSFLKKPFLVIQPFHSKNKNSFQKMNSPTLKKSTLYSLKFKLNQIVLKLFFYSILSSLVFSLKNFSFLTYSYFLKTLNFVETFIRSVYSFFEKPGELIVDWMAYLFLVEWASDLTTTIPDTIDTALSYSINKYSRSIRFPLSALTTGTSNFVLSFPSGASNFILVPSVSSLPSLNLYSSLGSFPLLTFLGGSLLQRRIFALYELLLTIACRPDTDLLIRQQKGQVFWDSWSDLLIEVAEKSNLNISELSTLKEEQNRLLEQLLVVTKVQNLKDLTTLHSNTSSKKKKEKNLNFSSDLIFKPFQSNIFLLNNSNSNFQLDSQTLSLWKRWSTNQFLSYQGKDTELFIDLHPPKSFEHLTSIKYSQSIQQPIGLVLCQIFSGIFYKQIAKNLLVVGPAGNEKSLLIQAIAGETELKIITDNAYRYAMVFRGVAVGIKLLRDVFEALTLHTPCIFLLEDIHAIGERRPLLISDDENTKGTESSFSTEREEVHEKNQVIYQLTKHIISHYKKPYKGDFSLLIPTNHFCFDLYNSLGFNEKQSQTNISPLSPISLINKTTTDLVATSKDKQTKDGFGEFETNSSSVGSKKLSSALQIEKNQLLAPPATSPFSVLVLKEEKKFKPKKLVKELPWAGLPGEQFANISKSTYSIRVKVALLADSVLSNLSVKLDMITDLLVIIDSVKGNRGFVVFATTHVPYILDPALRRPGRFDETLSLPQIPNLLSRWEMLNSKISVWQTCNSNQNLVTNHSISNITKNHSLKTKKHIPTSQSFSLTLNYQEPFSVYPLGISISAWENHRFKNLWNQKGNRVLYNTNNQKINPPSLLVLKENSTRLQKHSILVPKNYSVKSSILDTNLLKTKVKSLQLIKLHQLNLQKIYSIVSQILLSVQNSGHFNLNSQNCKWGDLSLSIANINFVSSSQGLSSSFYSTFNRVINLDSFVYMSLYSSPHIFKQHLTILMAGQIGQTFARSFGVQKQNYNVSTNPSKKYQLKGLEPPITNSWKTATSLVYAFIQKRIIYQKKLIVPRFLNFGLEGSKTDIPSPPASNILLPAKRYENYKRTFTVSELKYKTQLSIGEKIQIHQQQRLVKRLYKIPLKNYFRSEILNSFKNSLNQSIDNPEIQLTQSNSNLNNFTTFSNASIILAPLDKSLNKLTNMNWYFRNRILTRHQTYLSNQWWNGQLQEHNTEGTFLSDIDWRYSYFMNKGPDGNIGDLFIDFPDSEQYYNPKNQRWINTSGSWNSLFDMEKTVYNHSADHYIYECLMDAFKYLNENRELLDFYVINIFEKGINTRKEFNDMEILQTFKRFSGFSKV